MPRKFFEKRRVRRALASFIDARTAESLLEDGGRPDRFKQGHIEFVVAFVDDGDPNTVSERVTKVADISIEHGATVQNIIGALVIVAFGTGRWQTPNSRGRVSLVNALKAALTDKIKIVHGGAEGYYGSFGGGNRIAYTFFVPRFDQVLGRLSELPLGAVEDFCEPR